MLKILRVGTVGDDMIDIHLDNGNILMLAISLLYRQPQFNMLREDDRIYYPKTDGECVYWKNGPKLVLNEILEIMKE